MIMMITTEIQWMIPTEVTLDQNFDLQVTKSVNTIDNDNDGIIGIGDQAVYTIIVSNTGNIDLVSLQLSDTLTDFDGTTLGFRFTDN